LSHAYVNKEFCMAVCGPYILAEREMMSQSVTMQQLVILL